MSDYRIVGGGGNEYHTIVNYTMNNNSSFQGKALHIVQGNNAHNEKG